MGSAVKCVEDDILVEERCRDFLPLGLKARKFFRGYGFFDSDIMFLRKAFPGEPGGRIDMQFVYRCVYQDGDQEDLTYAQVISLRQLFNNRFVPESASQERQIPQGTQVELITGEMFEVTGHINQTHSLIVRWDGGGGVAGKDDRLGDLIIGVRDR